MCLIHRSEGDFMHYFYLFADNGLTCLFIILGMVAGAVIPIFYSNIYHFAPRGDGECLKFSIFAPHTTHIAHDGTTTTQIFYKNS